MTEQTPWVIAKVVPRINNAQSNCPECSSSPPNPKKASLQEVTKHRHVTSVHTTDSCPNYSWGIWFRPTSTSFETSGTSWLIPKQPSLRITKLICVLSAWQKNNNNSGLVIILFYWVCKLIRSQSRTENYTECVCVCVCVCARACMHAHGYTHMCLAIHRIHISNLKFWGQYLGRENRKIPHVQNYQRFTSL